MNVVPRPLLPLLLGFGAAALGWPATAAGAPVDNIQAELRTGHYPAAIDDAREAVLSSPRDETLHLFLVEGLMTVGRYSEAATAAVNGLTPAPMSIRLRWAGRQAALASGQPELAAQLTAEIRQYVANRPFLYRGAADRVVYARVALLVGADPKEVMDKVLAQPDPTAPVPREIDLAKGELALEKHDFELAAKSFQDGLKQFPDDPDLHGGLARAYASGDRAAMLAETGAALKVNPWHLPSLLLLVDQQIDAEDYAGADKTIEEILKVNAWRPEAWAYKAILADLREDPAAEKSARDNALRYWKNNPLVDWLIGAKLAEKYRFAEAAAAQRRALRSDAAYLPAEEELANDLLRLGDESEGWKLAEAVHTRDEYDVEAYNLSTLHDTMAKYKTLGDGDFVLRMTAPEATAYGARALELLARARRTLTAKYGVELAKPTYVEIFGDQKDFAVRTFGMPDIGGFLGVCFGRVVTANGPAANVAQPTNWETVLWHEFCHVVTLQLTQNKMPRWLSEGISVYEESQAEPSWGMHLDRRYREMIVDGDLTPVSRLSGAFLVPPSAEALQFAYLESSLVVEFIVQRYGLEQLKGILRDVGAGQEINAAIAAHTQPMAQLEIDFAAYARQRADQLAPQLDWRKPDPELLRPGAEAQMAAWVGSHPDTDWSLIIRSQELIRAKHWTQAQALLQHHLALYPKQIGTNSAYGQLATVDRALGQTAGERAALTQWAELDDNAADANLRLMELARADGDWPAEKKAAERFLAINPLVAPPYRALAEADEKLGDLPGAIAAARTELELGPSDPPEVHFQLARLLQRSHDPEARQQVLQALEDAPRFREALALLLEINSPPSSSSP
jgi:Tfp pilus assembly protein PilF